jgi:hypothetical protein
MLRGRAAYSCTRRTLRICAQPQSSQTALVNRCGLEFLCLDLAWLPAVRRVHYIRPGKEHYLPRTTMMLPAYVHVPTTKTIKYNMKKLPTPGLIDMKPFGSGGQRAPPINALAAISQLQALVLEK